MRMYRDAPVLRRVQKRENHAFRSAGFLASALLLALVSAGCGGGGGGGGTTAVSTPTTTSTNAVLEQIGANEMLREETRDKLSEVSQSIPKEGSVVQSTNVDSDFVTTDTLENVEMRLNAEGQLEGSVTLNGMTITTRDDLFERGEDPEETADLMKRTDDETLWMSIYSDVSSSADTDYLAAGIWLLIPNDAEDLDDLALGAFATGTTPFAMNDIQSLEGQATYSMDEGAVGLYVYTVEENPGENVTGWFNADVKLTAEFGNAAQLGTISGELSNLVEDGEVIDAVEGLVLELRGEGGASAAAITNTGDGGFFQGEIAPESNNIDGGHARFAGKWGGAFHGVASDGKPASVLGTFGFSGDWAPSQGEPPDWEVEAVGVFLAPKTP